MTFNNTTNNALLQLKKTLRCSLQRKYNIKDLDCSVDQILKIHGLSNQHSDIIQFVQTIIKNNINDVSIDDNSNKSNCKSVQSIHQQSIYLYKKLIGYNHLYEKMKQIYGKLQAKKLSGQMYDYSLGLADSTNILKPYCWAMDASRIVLEGFKNIPLQSAPAKHIGSYISILFEIVHQMSMHLAGAIAIGTIFLDVAHIALYKDKVDLRQIKTSTKYRKYIQNQFQKFIHSVNHLSRNAIESPFTNVSIFDRVKLQNFITQMNWYFPFDSLPIDMEELFETDEQKNRFCKNYIVDYIMEIQQIFIDFFDKGDTLKDGAPFRFPIVTVNFAKEDGKILDKKFLRYICKKDIFRYNIFVSGGSKIASCCRLLTCKQMLDLAAQSNSFGGGGSISLGSHRVVTLNLPRIALQAKNLYSDSIQQSDYFDSRLDDLIKCSIKILKSHKALIKDLTDKGLQKFITQGWINPDRMFSTLGITGVYEMAEIMKVDNTYVQQVLKKINDLSQKYTEQINQEYQDLPKLITNIQQIPAESYAVRLAKIDKMIFGLDDYYQMYSNQFLPLWKKSTIWQKMDLEGRYNKLLTGGGIAHINIGQKTTAIQNRKIIEYAVDSGCQHFALNSVYSKCKNEHITMGKNQNCPKCQQKIIDWYTRVVGYFVPVSNFNKTRRQWEFPKRDYQSKQELGL